MVVVTITNNADLLMANQNGDVLESTIPLQALGVVDVATNGVTDNELLANALANVSHTDKTDGWAVKWSTNFVNKYPCLDEDGMQFLGSTENPNHLLGSFPCLFPYSLGGFDVVRECNVLYEKHVCWALHYEDHHFHTDLHFMFQVFGVIQKRHMCVSAILQISKQSFVHFKSVICNLDSAAFEKAATEECTHECFTDLTMKALHKMISAV